MALSTRHVTAADRDTWLRLRCVLWPDTGVEEHREEISEFLRGEAAEPLAVLLAISDDTTVGFAELSIRAYAEGCHSGHIAFLEGWYVDATLRQKGVGRLLMEAAEQWAREQGCTEFGSDAHPDNQASIAAHLALGFEDMGLIRCFRKEIPPA